MTGINWASYFIEELLQMVHGQWMYINRVVHEWGEYSILQRERKSLKSKTRLKMEMGRRCLLLED